MPKENYSGKAVQAVSDLCAVKLQAAQTSLALWQGIHLTPIV